MPNIMGRLVQKEVQIQMRKYEIMYIIRPDVDEESKKAVVERFNSILTTNGAGPNR